MPDSELISELQSLKKWLEETRTGPEYSRKHIEGRLAVAIGMASNALKRAKKEDD